MAKRIGGARRKTRHKLQKNARSRGKISITNYFAQFKEGDRVALVPEPAIHSGMVFRRFIGLSGIVKVRTGRCYEVLINDRGKQKTLLVHPVHLKRL